MHPKISQLLVEKETKFVPKNYGSRPTEGCPDQWDNSNLLWQSYSPTTRWEDSQPDLYRK